MIFSVHQPQYLPWIGFFHKVASSDIFVFLDDVQYKKREFQNRNKIKTKTGGIYLTVPVLTKDKYYQKINEVEIDNSKNWAKEHLKSIKYNYSRTPYFKKYIDFFEDLYSRSWTKLVALNCHIITYVFECLNIKPKIFFSSQFNINSKSSLKIIEIGKKIDADTYLSGIGGREYLDEKLFYSNGIKLIYQFFVHPAYPQLFGNFLKYMSIIDLLFNCGEKSRDYLYV